MFNFNLAGIASLVEKTIEGKIEQMVEGKLEDMGREAVFGLIGGPLATAGRVVQAVQTGGMSELDRLRQDWLSSVTPTSLPGTDIVDQLIHAWEQNKHVLDRPAGKWLRWSKTRHEWLNEDWKHDWRTQPRDWHGRWMSGRLRSPYMARHQRRLRTMRRRQARKMARAIVSELNRGR